MRKCPRRRRSAPRAPSDRHIPDRLTAPTRCPLPDVRTKTGIPTPIRRIRAQATRGAVPPTVQKTGSVPAPTAPIPRKWYTPDTAFVPAKTIGKARIEKRRLPKAPTFRPVPERDGLFLFEPQDLRINLFVLRREYVEDDLHGIFRIFYKPLFDAADRDFRGFVGG